MKKSKRLFIILICIATLLAFLPVFTADAETDGYKIGLSVDKSARPGEKINVVCAVKSISVESGLCGISFTLTYDKNALSPDVVSQNTEDTSPYDAFMTKVPKYTISAGSTEAQVPAYENISRCYPSEGKYTLMYIDMLVYPGIKSGTTVDSTLKKDGDLTLSIPFTINKDLPNGYKASLKVTKVSGTTAGKEMKSVQGPDTSIILEIGSGGSSVITSKETEKEATSTGPLSSETEMTVPGRSESAGTAAITSEANVTETGNQGSAAASSSAEGTKEPGASGTTATVNKEKSSAPLYVAAGVTLLAAIIVIFVYLKKKNK